MGNFLGGSAYGMAQQIAEGYVLVTERTFKRLTPAECNKLTFELDKLLREVRAEQPSLDDIKALQVRNRKIGRLRQTTTMLRSYTSQNRR